MNSLLKIGKKRSDKLRITHFGLGPHEVALFSSLIRSDPFLAADYELVEPGEADACDILVVNKDSQLATSWWETYRKRNPGAIAMFFTDSKDETGYDAYCKRPFSPSNLRAAVQDFVSKNRLYPGVRAS